MAYNDLVPVCLLLLLLQLVYGGSGYTDTLADVWVLNPQQKAWTAPKVAGSAPPGREMHSVSMVGPTTMLVYGGRAKDARCACALLEAQL